MGRHVAVREGLFPQREIARSLPGSEAGDLLAIREDDDVVVGAFLDVDGLALVEGSELVVGWEFRFGEVGLDAFEAVVESWSGDSEEVGGGWADFFFT